MPVQPATVLTSGGSSHCNGSNPTLATSLAADDHDNHPAVSSGHHADYGNRAHHFVVARAPKHSFKFILNPT
jgi:hypothetical protein